MLIDLKVKDFALIENIHIQFSDHFNVLSGETGAGKSIIIDAVSLLLGARAKNSDVRSGANKAIVEGVFLLRENELFKHKIADIHALGCQAQPVLLHHQQPFFHQIRKLSRKKLRKRCMKLLFKGGQGNAVRFSEPQKQKFLYFFFLRQHFFVLTQKRCTPLGRQIG